MNKGFYEKIEGKIVVRLVSDCVINMNHINHVIKGEVYTNGKKYIIARRRRAEFNKKWNLRTT